MNKQPIIPNPNYPASFLPPSRPPSPTLPLHPGPSVRCRCGEERYTGHHSTSIHLVYMILR
jgi:hypothetical protein